ncbi:hypothetical protein BJ508DRAFT_302744 [Ascobolus immersus RN42]|uniref:Fido domain-containing protein n=1 Tax=Ascobolus immersus RN42 TaxID=1160509 RepID=A0A3N4IH47_ASCIM|nr:hypothetical protein BJ508DRAFT_302744 [Ascobolus immersus RN42]
MDRSSPNNVFTGFIEHDPQGPYSYSHYSTTYSPNTREILLTLTWHAFPDRYTTLTTLIECRGVQPDPYILMVHGWVCLRLQEVSGGLAMLMKAQGMVGIGADPLVDARICAIRSEVEWYLMLHCVAWATPGENNEFAALWRPYQPFAISTETLYRISVSLEEVGKMRAALRERFGQASAKGYLHLTAAYTNEIEGVFHLEPDSRRLCIAHEVTPGSISITRRTATLGSGSAEKIVKIISDTKASLEAARNRLRISAEPLTVEDLCRLHATALKSSCISVESGEETLVSPGALRKQTVGIYTGKEGGGYSIVQVCPPWKVEAELTRLMNDIQALIRDSQGDPTMLLAIAAWGHNAFENIHPFPDGNGRVGRLLFSMILGATGSVGDGGEVEGLEFMTIAPGSEYEDYIEALRAWDSEGGLDAMIDRILLNWVESLFHVRWTETLEYFLLHSTIILMQRVNDDPMSYGLSFGKGPRAKSLRSALAYTIPGE